MSSNQRGSHSGHRRHDHTTPSPHGGGDDNYDGQLTVVQRGLPTPSSRRRDEMAAPGQYMQVDPQTHAKHYYHNDGNGTQAYAYYYSSDQDPSHNNRDTSSHVRTMMCSYTGTTPPLPSQQQQQRRRTRDAGAAARQSRKAGEPIVEEPDDDDNDNDNNGGRGGGGRGGTVAMPQHYGDMFAAMQNDMMTMHRQMMSAMAMPYSMFGGDFFSDPFAPQRRHRHGTRTPHGGDFFDYPRF